MNFVDSQHTLGLRMAALAPLNLPTGGILKRLILHESLLHLILAVVGARFNQTCIKDGDKRS